MDKLNATMRSLPALLLGVLFLIHPYYVSVTDIKYNDKEKIVEVSCRTFTDDMEKALHNQNKQLVDLINPKDKSKANVWLETYIKQHLKLKLDGKIVILKYIGYEQEEEAIWTYFEVENIPAPKNVEIENTLLYEIESAQINMVHVEVNGKKKSSKLSSPDKVLKFEMN